VIYWVAVDEDCWNLILNTAITGKVAIEAVAGEPTSMPRWNDTTKDTTMQCWLLVIAMSLLLMQLHGAVERDMKV
jgi:hypothetical protein